MSEAKECEFDGGAVLVKELKPDEDPLEVQYYFPNYILLYVEKGLVEVQVEGSANKAMVRPEAPVPLAPGGKYRISAFKRPAKIALVLFGESPLE